MQEGMEIPQSDEPMRRGPGRPPKDAARIRPPLETADPRAVRPHLPVADSMREAEAYAQHILDNFGEAIGQTDEFFVNPDSIPDGWVYNWKSAEIAGKPNSYHMSAQTRMGWRPVLAGRHPELVPDDTPSESPIVKKGLMLMELPKILSDRYEMRRKKDARDQVENADRQLHETPPHTAPRDEFPEHMRKLKKETYRPVGQDAD